MVHLIGVLVGDVYMIATGVGTIDMDQAIAGTSLYETLTNFVEQTNETFRRHTQDALR